MKNVLLVGNPNAGKTTLFNSLTRASEHVGNWHGVTVETRQKSFEVGAQKFMLVDTPGIYSLCPLSFEEEVAVKAIFDGRQSKIINICDQNNLQRNLYLSLCLLERGLDAVIAINEIDRKQIFSVNSQKLGQILGVQVVKINAAKKLGLSELKRVVAAPTQKPQRPPYIDILMSEAKENLDFFANLQTIWAEKIKSETLEYVLIKAYERDEKFFAAFDMEKDEIFALFKQLPKDSMQKLCALRFSFVDDVMGRCSTRSNEVYGKSKFDKIALNKWLAFPAFLLVLAGIFYLTFFSVGAFLSDALSQILTYLTSPLLSFLRNIVGENWIYDLFNIAIFGGIGTVLSFLPQVVLLFFFLSILEDSGYMSRIAFIFEDILGKVGLSGKSVYTLLMGFGCSTTAIMTCRNMDDKNAKIKTALVCPYMSCTAKIPIYTVIGGAFFGAKNIFVIVGLYLLGAIVAICISKILDTFVLKSKQQSFILEFPPYRATSPKRICQILWKNVKTFLVKVGSVMLCMNIIVWILSSFSFKFSYVTADGGQSMLETIGRAIAPIFKPLGFGRWAIVSSLLAGIVAKEVVVSSIAMFNGIDASATKLIKNSILLPASAVYFSSGASVLSFLVFCLLYTPCMASISMLIQEVGGKWTAISVGLQLLCAYILAFVTYNIALAFEVFGFAKTFVTLVTLAIIFVSIVLIVKRLRTKKACPHCSGCGGCDKI